jgi:Mg-chelatase subunit ChlD
LGKRQLFGLDARNALQAVTLTRKFSPRARRFVKNAVQEYVNVLAADRNAWENRVLVDGNSLKSLVEYAKVSVSTELMAPLRDKKNWNSESWPKLKAAREFSVLAREGRYSEAAEVLKRYRLPLLFVEGCADISRPEIAEVIIERSATPKQLLNRLAKLARSGVFNDTLALEKVLAVLRRGDARVTPADVRRVRDVAGDSLPWEIQKVLADIEEEKRKFIKEHFKVDLSVKEICLIVDKSGSMSNAIAAAGQMAAYFADQGAQVKAVRFDAKAYEIVPELDENGKPDWRKTFAGIKAGGYTSIGAALKKAAEVAPAADLWIVLTDGGCNTHPYADENSPVPESGRAAVVWFDRSPSSGFVRWLRHISAEEFEPGTRNGRLDYAALDDLVRFCLAGDRIEEWVATLPVGVVEKLLLTA